MGTDVFLKWDHMSKDERVVQMSASRTFMMDAGKYGYLRAAIGMKRENALLRSVFPADYWYNRTGKPVRFDFRAGLPGLGSAAKIYIRSVQEGTVPEFKDYALVVMMDRVSNQMAEKAGFQKVSATEEMGLEEAKLWLQELVEFFGLGTKKQDGALNPGIYISWRARCRKPRWSGTSSRSSRDVLSGCASGNSVFKYNGAVVSIANPLPQGVTLSGNASVTSGGTGLYVSYGYDFQVTITFEDGVCRPRVCA